MEIKSKDVKRIRKGYGKDKKDKARIKKGFKESKR